MKSSVRTDSAKGLQTVENKGVAPSENKILETTERSKELDRPYSGSATPPSSIELTGKNRQSDLIEKFISNKPKIKPNKDVSKVVIGDSLKFDKKELMTETLARVYLEQKKYKKAIQAYKILSLKYPEKSGFFADRIKSVARLKEENTSYNNGYF